MKRFAIGLMMALAARGLLAAVEPILPDGDYVIYTALDEKNCLDVNGVKMDDGVIFWLWGEVASGAKTLNLTFDSELSTQESCVYKITAKHSGLLMTASNTTNDSPVVQHGADQSAVFRQRWEIKDAGDGYYTLHVMAAGASVGYLDVKDGKTGRGTGVIVRGKDTGSDRQKFKISPASVELPEGFAVQSSLNASQAQYINTEYTPTPDTCITADFMAFGNDQTSSGGVFFGVTGSGSSTDGVLLRYLDDTGNVYAWFCNADSAEANIGNLGGQHLKIMMRAGGVINGSGNTVSITTKGTPYPGPVYIFCGNKGGTPWLHQRMQLFSFKIYEKNKLKHNFVPCIKDDEFHGLYDVVDDKFFSLVTDGLPNDGYRKPDGGALSVPPGQYIDTGYKPNQNSQVSMDVNVNGKTEYWFGCWTNTYNRGAFALGNDGNGVYYGICNDGGTSTNGPVANGRHTVEVTPWEFRLDGAKKFEKIAKSRQPFQLDLPLYLFAQNRNGTAYVPGAQGTITCYGCTISEGTNENATVIRNFIPCIRNEDDRVGFYDSVGGEFYPLLQDVDPSQQEYSEEYLKQHDFRSETFVEFNRWEEDKLADFLTAAVWAMQKAKEDYGKYTQYGRKGPIGVVCGSYAYINVRITLRNFKDSEWTLSKKVVDLIRQLAYGGEKDKSISTSLVIEANPDYFLSPQTHDGHAVTNAFCSLDLDGGPIVIVTNERQPLEFAVNGYDDLRKKGYSTSVLYGLTFKGCKNPGGKGGAIRTNQEKQSRTSVRVINCTFSNCSADSGGALFAGRTGDKSTSSTEFYSKGGGVDPDRFRHTFPGSQLTQSDFDGIKGSNLYRCMFDACSAKKYGGAVYGVFKKIGTVITDCTFKNCRADGNNGGGIYSAQTAYRCTFDNCTAKGTGGGCDSAHNVVCCLFSTCSSGKGGGAIDRDGSTHVHVVSCTLDNCTANDDDNYAIVTYNGKNDKVIGCLLVKSIIKKNEHIDTGTWSFDSANFFIAPPADYHIKPDGESIRMIRLNEVPDTSMKSSSREWPLYIGGSDKWPYGELFDRDGQLFLTSKEMMIAGCYRAYTARQWEAEQERRKRSEWKSLNPLEVTVAEDVVNPKDGKISFREACQYLERHLTAPGGVCADQWPKITFALPRDSRAVVVTNVVTIDDKNRAESFGVGLTGRQPVLIDGGTDGMTIRNGGKGTEILGLNVAGVVSNVFFQSGSVAVGANLAPRDGKIRVSVLHTNSLDEVYEEDVVRSVNNDLYMSFGNCSFLCGEGADPILSSTVGNVRFLGCTFRDLTDEGCSNGLDLNVGADWCSIFNCCTFAGFRKAFHVISFKDDGGGLRLANCTFAENAGVVSDVLIDGRNGGGEFRALNCIFADTTAYTTNATVTKKTSIHCEPIHTPQEYKKGELMVNVVTDSRNEVFDSQRFARIVKGVEQCAYKPKHSFTARYGRNSYRWPDTGATMEQPALDIFQQPQTGRFHSMGSYYVDDVESASIGVTTEEDVTDPYDDEISLREAINYGNEASGSFVQGLAVTPTFGDGVTSLSVTGAIRIAGNSIYKDYVLKIGPAEGRDLTIGSGTNSQDGVFAQDAGTKLQFGRVKFERCGTLEGEGGVLETAGRYRFDDCTFDSCWAAGVKSLPCDKFLSELDGEIKKLKDAGFAQGDFGLSEARAITNTAKTVAAAKAAIARAYEDQGGGMDGVREAAENAANQYGSTVLDVCAVLTNAAVAMGQQQGQRDVLDGAIRMARAWSRTLAESGLSGGNGGAICASASANGNVCNVSAHDGFALGSGGVIASEGNLVGANLTFCRNKAVLGGAAVACGGGTNLFASVAFVDNVSEMNGAVHVTGGQCGIANGIVIANATSAGDPNVTAEGACETNLAYTIYDATAKGDVFLNGGEPIAASSPNGIEQLYYPLDIYGKAHGTGAFVFFTGERRTDDSRDVGWLSNVFYSPDADGRTPQAQPLVATKKGFNTYLLYDLLGNKIECWDSKLRRNIPASMGPVPNVAAAAVSNVVTTARDDASVLEGAVSFRAAAEYAMSNDVPVVFAEGLGKSIALELNRQIDVPRGKRLRIDPGAGRTVELYPAEAKVTNRFFNVAGSLSAVGMTLRGGYSRSSSEYMSLEPANDGDGGAVWGIGPMAFTNCAFLSNRASKHGGAIYSSGGLSVAGCTFVSNRAEHCGGAIYSWRGDLSVVNTKITGNAAGKSGGGIYVFGVGPTNFVSVTGSDIVANHAVQVAGGLYLDGGAEDQVVRIDGIDTRVLGNTSGEMSDNVFVGDWVMFEESNVQRVPSEYVRVVTDGGLPRFVLDEEKAKPELGDFDLGAAGDGAATVVIDNVVPGLWYGIGRAESPVGPYVVDEWIRAKSSEPLVLTAPKAGSSGFYRVMARE